MPRPHEIAADARALYGPLALRPSAQEAGDGALWVDPSAQQPLTQVQSGNWVALAPTGVPVLRGPYTVEYTDIPHDGDTKVLWTPQVGDVILGITVDMASWVEGQTAGADWVNAGLDVGTVAEPQRWAAAIYIRLIASIAPFVLMPWVCQDTSPIQVRYNGNGQGGDMTRGHAAFYALVARAVAP